MGLIIYTMEKEYSQEMILKSFEKAHPAVREILSSIALAELISDIAKRNSLTSDKMVKVAEYNRNLLLGLTSPTKVLENLISIRIPTETSKKILEELNQKVFIPTHEKILHSVQKQENTKQKISTPINPEQNAKKYPTTELAPTAIQTKDKEISHTLPKKNSAHDTGAQIQSDKETPVLPVEKPTEKPIAKNYVTDPYRESFE